MAEVLSPPMPSSSTITMLHSRPSSADAFQNAQQYPSRLTQAPRSMYNAHNHGYRGAAAPVQPYAFQSTPNLRTSSAPPSSNGPFAIHKPTASTSTTSSDSSSPPPATKEEPASFPSRTLSLINIDSSVPDLSLTSFGDTPSKTVPDRYRRPTGKRVDSGSNHSASRTSSPVPHEEDLYGGAVVSHPRPMQRQISVDDVSKQHSGASETPTRYRRRSFNQMDGRVGDGDASQTGANLAQRPATAHGNGTSPLQSSSGALPASANLPQRTTPGGNPAVGTMSNSARPSSPSKATGRPSSPAERVTVPARGSSEAVKRLAAPSPLSRQTVDMDSPPSSPQPSPTQARGLGGAHTLSPAAQQLSALSDKDLNKGMKSRLRRAFSFGSAQELRKAGMDNTLPSTQQTREQHQQQIDEELDAEQLEIARRQEAAGIGAGIYSGQGGFTGSTDNLSISSTASSASMMLRKMGRGAKKSARSIKGLFRPKSVIGVPAADGPLVGPGALVEASVGQVSMVTVEAERQNVNVNAHPDERTGGGTAFPKLERNSLDAASTGIEPRVSNDKADAHLRRSIVGNDQERAEVLASVRKGILKRSGTASPSGSPIVSPQAGPGLPPQIGQLTESPSSSVPSTPKEAPHPRSSSAPVVNGDYFATRTNTKSQPNTPNGSVRSISFSPRIQFHDAWSSTDYDRRGEIATCNRLTPLLAQQIKEELNTFKMEMEVHEQSKPHTHFF